MEETIFQRDFSPGEQFLPELFWECRQYNTLQCWRQKKVHMLSPACRPVSSVYTLLIISGLSTSFRGPQDRCFPGQQICLVQHSSTHTHWSRSKSTIGVFCDLTFKLKNSPTWAELLLHPGSLLRCQGTSSKLAIKAPELAPLF